MVDSLSEEELAPLTLLLKVREYVMDHIICVLLLSPQTNGIDHGCKAGWSL